MDGSHPPARAHAPASAAKPEEELASPAAVGKLLTLEARKRSAIPRVWRSVSKNIA